MTITAIIPTYKRADLVGRAIQSVLAQTHPVNEIIVVDDGSPDNGQTRAVVEGFSPQVRYIRHQNQGMAASRNTGVREARSEWVAFLDDDDEWLPNKIEAQVTAIQTTPGAELCYTGLMTVIDGKQRSWNAVPVAKLWPMVRYRTPFTPISILVRRDSFLQMGGFNEQLRCAEDWEFSLRFLIGRTVVAADPPLVFVHTHVNRLSFQVEKMMAAELSLVETLLTGLRGPSRWFWRLRIISRIYYRAALSLRHQRSNFWPHLLRSLALWPSPWFESQRFATLAVEVLAALRHA